MNIVSVKVEVSRDAGSCSDIHDDKTYCRFCNHRYCNLFEQDLDEASIDSLINLRLDECISAQCKAKLSKKQGKRG